MTMDIGVLPPATKTEGSVRDAAPTRRVMVVAIMVSMVAFLDSTVVNLALPATTTRPRRRPVPTAVGRRRLLAGAGGHDSAGRFHLRSVRASTGDAFRAGGLWYGLGVGGHCGLAGDADHRARHPRVGRRVSGARLAGADQLRVRPRRPTCSHRVLDCLDRHRLCVGTAARGTGRGFPQLAMDLCLVGDPDGHRLRLDVLAVPDARARPNAPASTSPAPRCRRSGWPRRCMH